MMAKKKADSASPFVPPEEQPYQVPENWCWVRLDSLLEGLTNGTTIKQDKSGKGYAVTRIESLQNQSIDFARVGYIIDASKIKESDWYKNGDIALSHINSAEHVGKTALITENMLPLVHGMNLLRLRFRLCLLPQLFQLFSQSYQYKIAITARMNMAVNQVSINQKQLGTLEIPLPPLAEQQRIVELIESLFAKLDEAKEKAQEALAGIELREKAILEKAFRGKLGTNNPEDGDAKELIDMASAGKVAERNKAKASDAVSPFVPPEERPYEVPENWRWVYGKNIFKPMETRKPSGLTFAYIDIDAIDNVNQRVKAPKIIETAKAPSRASRGLHIGDTLFSLVRPYLKNIAYIDESLKDCIASTGFFVCSPIEKINNKYVYWIMTSNYVVDGLNQYMKGDNSPSIRSGDIEHYTFPIPPLAEQQRIVERIESLFAKESQAKAKITATLAAIDAIKKAILAKAFRGELGTNNPADGSAEELLRRTLA